MKNRGDEGRRGLPAKGGAAGSRETDWLGFLSGEEMVEGGEQGINLSHRM